MSAHVLDPKRVSFRGLLVREDQLARQIVSARNDVLRAMRDGAEARTYGNDEMEAEFLRSRREGERTEAEGIETYEQNFGEFDFHRWVDTEGW